MDHVNRKNCISCGEVFPIWAEDRKFYARMVVPEPKRCPQCRQRRRAAFRNSRNLYPDNCDYSGKSMVSIYSPEKYFTVFDPEIWWSDQWDGLAFGQDFDFSREFFPQFKELMAAVPRPALFSKGSENSAYTNHAVYNKNCYMCFNAGYCVDTLYSGDVAVKCTDCCDLTNVIGSELLCESVDCENCYRSAYLTLCRECHDSTYLFDCRNCHHCFLCSNLRNQSYCIENRQYTKAEYEQRVAQLAPWTFGSHLRNQQRFDEFLTEQGVCPATVTIQCENVSGNYIFNSKNIFAAYDVRECEDLRYCFDAWDIKSSMDTFQTMDRAELSYETHASSVSVEAKFCNVSHENRNIEYTDLCFNSSNLFGCVGLKHQEYCIFNQKYRPAEFRALQERLIAHMRETGEYGEFFPATLSPFGYNETVAQEYFPLTRSAAVKLGFNWADYAVPKASYARIIDAHDLADDLSDTPDDVTEVAIQCSVSGRLFKINQPQLELYRKLQIALPREHPDVRHARRTAQRGTRSLAPADCSNCFAEISSAVPAGRFAAVLCHACYLDKIL